MAFELRFAVLGIGLCLPGCLLPEIQVGAGADSGLQYAQVEPVDSVLPNQDNAGETSTLPSEVEGPQGLVVPGRPGSQAAPLLSDASAPSEHGGGEAGSSETVIAADGVDAPAVMMGAVEPDVDAGAWTVGPAGERDKPAPNDDQPEAGVPNASGQGQPDAALSSPAVDPSDEDGADDTPSPATSVTSPSPPETSSPPTSPVSTPPAGSSSSVPPATPSVSPEPAPPGDEEECNEQCASGAQCEQDQQCASNVCQAAVCVGPEESCEDRRKNGSETDTDCGPQCVACARNKACRVDSDCMSERCVSSKCQAGGFGAWCDRNADCISRQCDSDGWCAQGAAGDRCYAEEDCRSAACDNGQCLAAQDGDSCEQEDDCLLGLCVLELCVSL